MRFNLIPRFVAGQAQWQWRLMDATGYELCASPVTYATCEEAEAAVDALMVGVRGPVDVVRYDPTAIPGQPWAETIIVSYQAEGDHPHGDEVRA